jgi:N-acetyl-beta-hexosaminidase
LCIHTFYWSNSWLDFSYSWWQIPSGPLRNHVKGVQIAVWSTSAASTYTELFERVPAMADRSWAPMAMRTFADYQVRANRTSQLLTKLVAANYTH